MKTRTLRLWLLVALVAATTRASVYLYNTPADLDALAEGLERVKKTFAR